MSIEATTTKKPSGILGIGAAACAACCAGPILGFIAATGLLTAGGLALFAWRSRHPHADSTAWK